MGFIDRLQHGWNAFLNRDPTYYARNDKGSSYYLRPDRPRLSRGNERTIIASIENRIALDVAALDIKHVRNDKDGRYLMDMDSDLNYCLTAEANIDQTGRNLIHDVILSMLDEGCVAVVPVDTTFNPTITGSYDIQSMRVAKILQWKPHTVQVRLYNEEKGEKEDIWLPKKMVAIIENPLYAVMNEPNSTMQRLIQKLRMMDSVDEQTSSGKLDMIIQLPYSTRSELRKQQAEERRKDIENQLGGSKYGIAYIDAAEHVTQLNRSLENNLMKQIEYLTDMFYSQIGITKEVLNGTADEKTMLNYYNRTIEPIASAIVDEMSRKFLTKTARTKNQTITFFRDPFKLVPINELADIADKFTRNEILSSNEIRQIVGRKPSSDPNADELRNKNLNKSYEEMAQDPNADMIPDEEQALPEGEVNEDYTAEAQGLDELDTELDELEKELNHSDDELAHYSSPYYDPVKAHEYYERTKQLKGRTSTAKLNDKGKQAATYVKQQLNAERKKKVKVDKDRTNANIESYRNTKKAAVAAHMERSKNQISSLRDKLKSMTRSEKVLNRDKIQAEIDKIRDGNTAMRDQLGEKYRTDSTKARQRHKDKVQRLKQEYDNKYASELSKMRKDKSLLKPTKKKKKK